MERWFASPYSSSGADSGVAPSLWMRLQQRHTARRRPQPKLGQQMVFCTTTAQIIGVLQKVFY